MKVKSGFIFIFLNLDVEGNKRIKAQALLIKFHFAEGWEQETLCMTFSGVSFVTLTQKELTKTMSRSTIPISLAKEQTAA